MPATQTALGSTWRSPKSTMPNKKETTTEVRRTGEISEISASGWAMAVK